MDTHLRHHHLWRQANVRLLPSAFLCVAGAVLSSIYGKVRDGSIEHKLIALIGVAIFILFAGAFLRVLTNTIYRILSYYHLTTGRAAAIKFIMRIIGYVAIFLTTLDLVGVPVGKLLLGGAAIGIILGVAAQQALANFFASVVLIISHPFSVGQRVIIMSGGLGGRYVGTIKDIGLTHTKLEDEDGNTLLFPNAGLLSGATIMSELIAHKKPS